MFHLFFPTGQPITALLNVQKLKAKEGKLTNKWGEEREEFPIPKKVYLFPTKFKKKLHYVNLFPSFSFSNIF